MGRERTAASQVASESLGLPPGVGSWLLEGKSSRKSHSEAEEGLTHREAEEAV